MQNLSTEDYVRALERMKRGSRDRVGVLAELGVAGVGVATGVAVSGTIAAAAGAATFAGSATLGSIVSGVLVTTTPVGWVIGSAVAGGAMAYGLIRLVRGGAKCDALRNRTIRELETRVAQLRHEAQQSRDTEEKMVHIITGLQHLVANDHLSQDRATEVLGLIERGLMQVDEALSLIQDLIAEKMGAQR